jgi:regulator of sirC expression with transglutaminase-like and TPR domain
MPLSLARLRFLQEINQPDEQIDLARAALYMAQEEYPELDPEEYLNALDSMAAEVEEKLPAVRYPLRVINTINEYLFKDLLFFGNRNDYYDPRNSYLNEVIERRMGIPITLSLLYLEIAKRIDFPMVGVGMPGHFIIRPTVNEMQLFVDPFNQGEVLFEKDCENLLSDIYGEPVTLRPEFLEAVTPRQFLARMLTNLKAIYLKQGDFERGLAIVDRVLALFPNAVMERRDRGLLYYQLGRWQDARPDLADYLAEMPYAQDAPLISQMLQRIQEM